MIAVLDKRADAACDVGRGAGATGRAKILRRTFCRGDRGSDGRLFGDHQTQLELGAGRFSASRDDGALVTLP